MTANCRTTDFIVNNHGYICVISVIHSVVHQEHHNAVGVPGAAAEWDARRNTADTPQGAGRELAPVCPKGLTEVGKK